MRATALAWIFMLLQTTPIIHATSTIGRFILVNARTHKSVRPLVPNDVISVDYPINIITELSGSGVVDAVTFTEPFYRRETFEPYALAGDWPTRTYLPLRIPDGRYRISAYVNGDMSNRLSINVSITLVETPDVPLRGPIPEPVKSAVDSFVDVEEGGAVPVEDPVCGRDGVPQPTVREFVMSPFRYGEMKITVRVEWCVGASFVRQRVLKYQPFARGGKLLQQTEVLQSRLVNFLQDDPVILLPMACEQMEVYVEYCVRQEVDGRLLCGTSDIFTVPHRPVPEPRLTYRPPIEIKLSPGDVVRLQTVIESRTSTESGFANGGFDLKPRNFVLWGIVESENGTRRHSTVGSSSGRVKTYVPPRKGIPDKGVTLEDDGALLYMRYAVAECQVTKESFRERFPTRLLVDTAYGRLVRQDGRLPEFATPTYPPTAKGDRVLLTVEARNVGGGLRESMGPTGGKTVPTTLQYQWYVRKMDRRPDMPTYAEMIVGATSSTLLVQLAECDDTSSCGRFGCWRLRRYFVDVCNTFGCRRSDAIVPKIVGPC